MISSGGSDGGAGGSGSVPNRRTLCSSVGGGVSGPCVSCASDLPALRDDTKMAKTKNAKARVIRRSRRRFARSETESRKAGPMALNLKRWARTFISIWMRSNRPEQPAPRSRRTAYRSSFLNFSLREQYARLRHPFALCYNLPFCERAQTSQALFRLGNCTRGRLPLFCAARGGASAPKRLCEELAGRPRLSLCHRARRTVDRSAFCALARSLGRRRPRSRRRGSLHRLPVRDGVCHHLLTARSTLE